MSRGTLLGLILVVAAAALAWLYLADADHVPATPSGSMPEEAGEGDGAADPVALDAAEKNSDESRKRRAVPAGHEEAPCPDPLRIITEDAQGQPIGGVPVALWQGHSKHSQQLIWRGSTGVDGEVVVADFSASRQPIEEVGPRFVAMAMVPAERPAAIEFDGREPPAGALRLVLPALGRVEIEVADRFGRAVPLATNLRLAAEHVRWDEPPQDLLPEWCDRWTTRLPGSGAKVALEHVAVGTRIQAIAVFASGSGKPPQIHNQTRSEWTHGPLGAGQTCELRAELPEHFGVLAGRAVDAEGEPLADRTLQLEVRPAENGRSARGEVRTDQEGRWAMLLRHRGAEQGTLLLTDAPSALVGAMPLPRWPSAEVLELGDTRLWPGLLALEGQVVNDLDEPVADVPLEFTAAAQVEMPGNYPGPRRFQLRVRTRSTIRSDAEGRFVFMSPTAEETVRVQLRASGYLPFRSEQIPFGRRDVVLRPQRAGRIEFNVDCGESRPPSNLMAWLTRSDAAVDEEAKPDMQQGLFHHRSSDPRGRSTTFSRDEPYQASMDHLVPGVYSLRIATKTIPSDILAELSEIRIEAGQTCADPRLIDIPIAIGKHRYQIRLVHDGPDPSTSTGYYHGAYEESEQPGWRMLALRRDTLDLYSDSPRIRVELRGWNCRTLFRELEPGYHELKLRQSPSVDLPIREVREATGGRYLMLQIARLDQRPRRWRDENDGRRFEQPSNGLTHGSTSASFHPPAPGRYSLELSDLGRTLRIGTITVDQDMSSPASLVYSADWPALAAELRAAHEARGERAKPQLKRRR